MIDLTADPNEPRAAAEERLARAIARMQADRSAHPLSEAPTAFLDGWYTAAELRELANLIDTAPPRSGVKAVP